MYCWKENECVGVLFRAIGRFASGLKLTDVPTEVIDKAKLVFLDTLGVALASSTMDFGAMVTQVARKLGGDSHSVIIGSPHRVAAANAVTRQRHTGPWLGL